MRAHGGESEGGGTHHTTQCQSESSCTTPRYTRFYCVCTACTVMLEGTNVGQCLAQFGIAGLYVRREMVPRAHLEGLLETHASRGKRGRR